jgi:hypothetical protein
MKRSPRLDAECGGNAAGMKGRPDQATAAQKKKGCKKGDAKKADALTLRSAHG